jgi:hypothetical protein
MPPTLEKPKVVVVIPDRVPPPFATIVGATVVK